MELIETMGLRNGLGERWNRGIGAINFTKVPTSTTAEESGMSSTLETLKIRDELPVRFPKLWEEYLTN